MIKALRTRHLQVWAAMAFIVPVGIFYSWLVIPNNVPVKILKQQNSELLPLVKYSQDKPGYCVNIRTNKQKTAWQLEWKNKLPLKAPSAVIYRKVNRTRDSLALVADPALGRMGELIGRIEAQGSYVFDLPGDVSANQQQEFVVYDFIHQQVIDSLKF